MLDHVQNFVDGHGAAMAIVGVAAVVGTVFREYGKRLEARTRERNGHRLIP